MHGSAGFYTPDIEACLEDPECVDFPASALDGDDHLELDGSDGYAATAGPVAEAARAPRKGAPSSMREGASRWVRQRFDIRCTYVQ